MTVAANPRPVPHPRLSAGLYGLLAAAMVVAMALCGHGAQRAVVDAQVALALRDTAAVVVPEALGLARGEVAVPALAAPLRAWLIDHAPDPDAAAAQLDAVLAAEDPGSPRAVARQIGDRFADRPVDDAFLAAWLMLSLRGDVEGAGETIVNALALNAGVALPRRQVDDVFSAYLAQAAGETVAPDDLATADALALRIAALPDAVTTTGIYLRASLLVALLAAFAVGAVGLAIRFGRDAAVVWRQGTL